MSDFVNSGWSVFIATVTILGLVGCLLLLLIASRRKVRPGQPDDNTTGHVWDGDLRELNNPLPLWWMGLFVITLAFAAGYLVLYPGLGHYAGSLGWTSRGQYEQEIAAANAKLEKIYAPYAKMPIEQLAKDPQAMAIGERLFMNNCAACHGSDARGSKGFPNLTDNDWLHGGTPADIQETITNGRVGQMPPMAAAVGSAEDVHNVANYVLSLSGSPHNDIAAQLGKPKFVVCAACHGADGKGNTAIGSANLTDHIWLHGWGEAAIVNMIDNGKTNIMPAQKDRYTPEQIRVLTAFVWGLSNGGVSASLMSASQ